jgi:hypothetical protein
MCIFSLQETARLKKSRTTSIYRNALLYPTMYSKMIVQKENIRETQQQRKQDRTREKRKTETKRENRDTINEERHKERANYAETE